jgi:O-acetyl-ADP-ribose deacetylase (regulator of RNase III)
MAETVCCIALDEERRTLRVGRIAVHVVEADIATLQVDVLINAANISSFTPMDCGVSGALRNACRPADVVGVEKIWWDEEENRHEDKTLPVTQAGVQELTHGGLFDRGVKHIVHAVGPTWTDYPIEEETFSKVVPNIKLTVKRALNVAERINATSCALPAISGGIFTHWKINSDIKAREMLAARVAAVEAIVQWAEKNPDSCLVCIKFCDLPEKRRGNIELCVRAFDAVTNSKVTIK